MLEVMPEAGCWRQLWKMLLMMMMTESYSLVVMLEAEIVTVREMKQYIYVMSTVEPSMWWTPISIAQWNPQYGGLQYLLHCAPPMRWTPISTAQCPTDVSAPPTWWTPLHSGPLNVVDSVQWTPGPP